jgi:3-oxoacyl-[acyl-carrier protein] reductase
MFKRPTGKAALVTGGSRGIGAAIAKRLAAEGANVAITYAENKEAAETLVAELKAQGSRAFAIRANAGDAQDAAGAVRRVVEKYGGIDILVHNAGVAGVALLPESDFADSEITAWMVIHAAERSDEAPLA